MSSEQSITNKKVQGVIAFAAKDKTFRMPLFRPGTVVMRGNTRHTVSYVMVRRGELWVYLNGKETPVRSDTLQAESVLFSTVRQPDPRLL